MIGHAEFLGAMADRMDATCREIAAELARRDQPRAVPPKTEEKRS